jgi:hypothetical protein
MFDVNWTKWIWASGAKHFNGLRQGVHLHIEGEPRQTGDLHEFAEFRLLGPKVKETSRGHYDFEIRINILVTVGAGDVNKFRVHEVGGIFLAAFTRTIPVLRLGIGEDDDGTQWDCFSLTREASWNYYGQVDVSKNVLQGTVDGRYKMSI